ncbi:MAG: DEAD/DEAH box helicase [Saccharofermentanales bacterium]
MAVTGALYKSGKIKKALIVCPLSIVGVWQEEFQKFAAFDYLTVTLEGSSEKKAEMLQQTTGRQLQVVIVNYESMWRLEKELLNWDADMVIADEGHKIKTHNISASKSMHKLGAKARYRMLLTGTLITNKALDVFSQYKFLNPSIFGPSFYSFRCRYFDMTGFGSHTPVLKKSMESDLTQKIHSIAYRTTKAECLDLPEIIDIVRLVELETTAARIYKGLVEESFAELLKGEVTVTNILTRLLRLSQLTGGFIGDDEGNTPQKVSSAKLSALEDIIDEVVNENRKLVVIARFIPEIKAICKLLESKKIQYSLIMGGIKNRDVQVSQFQNDPAVQVFVGQIATAGLGITLTAASTMVFYSVDYSMSNFEQTKARIHRVGQKYPCTYIYLAAVGTVDEKVLKALQNKSDLAKTLIDECMHGRNPYK